MSDWEDSMELDSLVVVPKCLVCSGDGASMKLLVCSAIECPLSFHEECTNFKPAIDENGKFYCPYCAYKRHLVKVEKARKKVLRSRDLLNMFIRSAGVVNDGGEDEDDKEGINDKDKGTGEAIGGKTESSEAMEVETIEDQDLSKGDSDQQCDNQHNQIHRGDGEKAIAVLPKTTKVPDMNQNEKTTEPIYDLEFGSGEGIFHNSRGKKIYWTADELKMLKEGVQHYSAQGNKNTPWRKILDRGSHVFHETRSPGNLKDKWQRLCREATNRKQT